MTESQEKALQTAKEIIADIEANCKGLKIADGIYQCDKTDGQAQRIAKLSSILVDLIEGIFQGPPEKVQSVGELTVNSRVIIARGKADALLNLHGRVTRLWYDVPPYTDVLLDDSRLVTVPMENLDPESRDRT
jgi:hypothetical protein